nr:MAG TPA: hypothetical protein [Caudoviricetes sp.]DAX75142.1 MAG TPA: hypothetical protein [Caudoviricetes sp.]
MWIQVLTYDIIYSSIYINNDIPFILEQLARAVLFL